MEVVDGRDTYTTVDVPMNPDVTSVENKLRAVLIVARSERRLESLACFKSSAGLRVTITTTERIATRAKTTNNSIRVNERRFLLASISIICTIRILVSYNSSSYSYY